ncbi:hypothetical protein RQP46_004922 [Phenoliferia psychrophenolica]
MSTELSAGVDDGLVIPPNQSWYLHRTTKDYFPISQHTFGLLEPNSPVDGLCTCSLASCLAFVVHCPETRKSTLTHTPTNVESWRAFEEQIKYVVDGGTGREVTVHIIKGAHYTPENIIKFEHADVVSEFKEALEEISRSTSTSLTFIEVKKKVPHGALLLEKATGTINILVLPGTLTKSTDTFLNLPTQYENVNLPTSLYQRQANLAKLESSWTQDIIGGAYQIYCQYDGTLERFSVRLSDGPREILAAKRRGATPHAVLQLTKSLSGQFRGFPNYSLFTMNLDGAVSAGTWCEVCGTDGNACSRCGAVYYCGKEHQKEDWGAHKGW